MLFHRGLCTQQTTTYVEGGDAHQVGESHFKQAAETWWLNSLVLISSFKFILYICITFCVITIEIISIFTIFFLVLSVVLAQMLFHVSLILKLYVNFNFRNFDLYHVLSYTLLLELIQPNLQSNSQLKMIVKRSKHVLF